MAAVVRVAAVVLLSILFCFYRHKTRRHVFGEQLDADLYHATDRRNSMPVQMRKSESRSFLNPRPNLRKELRHHDRVLLVTIVHVDVPKVVPVVKIQARKTLEGDTFLVALLAYPRIRGG